jgi:hypothetical protein
MFNMVSEPLSIAKGSISDDIMVELHIANSSFDGFQLALDLFGREVVLVFDGHTLQLGQLEAAEAVLPDLLRG